MEPDAYPDTEIPARALVLYAEIPPVTRLNKIGEQVNILPKPWATDPAVQALATKLAVPADFVVDQTLRSVFEDPHTQFLIRVWYGPATPHTAL